MKFYLLRGLDEKTWSEFKAQCAMDNTSIKDKIISLIKQYLRSRNR